MKMSEFSGPKWVKDGVVLRSGGRGHDGSRHHECQKTERIGQILLEHHPRGPTASLSSFGRRTKSSRRVL